MLPHIKSITAKQSAVNRFGGINYADGTPLGEWEELHNIWFSSFPALRTVRGANSTTVFSGNDSLSGGFLEKDGEIIFTVTDGIYFGAVPDGKGWYKGGEKLPLNLSEGRKRLVSMGAYIIILPDFICINTADTPKTVTSLSADGSTVTGTAVEYNSNRTYPTVSVFKRLYIDVDENSPGLKDYAAGDCVELSWTYKNRKMKRQFTVESISVEDYTVSGCKSVIFDTSALDTTYFYLEDKAQDPQFRIPVIKNTVMKKVVVADMDFVTEHNNRLWGCSSKNREIYCSKLGEPLKWGEYKGISTDSWAAKVGSEGDFTGVAVYNDSVLFFKENCVHIVYGTKASNFSVTTVPLRGVQRGSENSLCISKGLLYYKAPEGIFCFNGSNAVRVDTRLGRDIPERLVGVADDTKIVMAQAECSNFITKMYVYDTVHNAWYTRDAGILKNCDNTQHMLFGYVNGGRLKLVHYYELYKGCNGISIIELPDNNDFDFYGSAEYPEFSLQTGELNRSGGIMRHITKLKLVIGIVKPFYDADNRYVRFNVKLSFDGGEFETFYSYDSRTCGTAGEILTLPIIPRRSQRIKMRIDGEINRHPFDTAVPSFTLHGIYYSTEGGSELG